MTDWAARVAQAGPAPLAGELRRLVESQEEVATSRLVSSLARQAVLEDLLETTKPPRRDSGLHYLLATPFRYPPLKHGSRFGTRHEPSLFYGSQATRTVLAEAAYYRFVFWYGMAAPPPGKLDTQHTLFGAAWRTAHGLRLQASPFDTHRAQLTDPADYAATQALGAAMRAAGVEAFEFVSARDTGGGLNVALFTPGALSKKQPAWQEAWLCELAGAHVRFRAARGREMHDFPVADFLVNGALPWPA
ncbi:RES family NAD+ phosphorylase [Betaproteobacteria bacterium SCN1]|nr:RES family NAD+ phosphorylase [Betaproteobacteria bacterium SCN1]